MSFFAIYYVSYVVLLLLDHRFCRNLMLIARTAGIHALFVSFPDRFVFNY